MSLRRIVFLSALVLAGAAHASTARLITTDAAEVLERPVLGLQRSALPIWGGIAVDTVLLADLALTPNLGVRWAGALGDQRFVVGARYAHFVGAGVVSDAARQQTEGTQATVTRLEPQLSGPTFYAVYGVKLGPVLLQVEGKHAIYELSYTSLTGAAELEFAPGWGLVAEGGWRFQGGPGLRAAGGLRHAGEHFGFTLGLAYVQLTDPALPDQSVAVLPALDLSWTF